MFTPFSQNFAKQKPSAHSFLFYDGWLLKFSLGFQRVFIFSVTLDTRKNERQMSVSTIET
jgi:hypothetical protein